MKSRLQHSLLTYTKRGLASLFVCWVTLLPLLTLASIPRYFIHKDTRKVTALPAFETRQADKNTDPIKPFDEPLISVTFDDGWESVYTVAAPILTRNGIRSTQYLLSGTEKDNNYLSSKQIKALHDARQEVACHTIDHKDLTTLDDTQLRNQLAQCQEHFSKSYGSVVDFAAPYGHTDPRVKAAIKNVYRSHRNTDGDIYNGVNEADINLRSNFDPYNIIGITIRRDTTTEEIKQAVDYTIAHNGWLVITYHQIDEQGSQYGLDAQNLNRQLSYLSSTPVRIAPMGEVLNALKVRK